MIDKIYKYIGITLLFMITLAIVSCEKNKKVSYNKNKSVSINQMFKEKNFISLAGCEIVRCINERDKYSLSNLFCEKVRNTEYLNNQIDFFFEYIDEYGIQIDEAGQWVSNGGHKGSNGWNFVVDFKGARYNKNITINGKKYDFSFGYYKTLKKHKEYEGITGILFRDERNLINVPLDKVNIAKNDRSPGAYLGIGIYNTNYDTYLRENVAPKEIYENEEYRFDGDKLEKNHDNW